MRLIRNYEEDGFKKIQLAPNIILYSDSFNAGWHTYSCGWMFVHNTSENNPDTYLVTYNNIKPTRPRYKYNDLTRSKYINFNGHRFENFKIYRLKDLKYHTETVKHNKIDDDEYSLDNKIFGRTTHFSYGPKIDFEKKQIEDIVSDKYYKGKRMTACIHIASIKNYLHGNIDDKELLKGFVYNFLDSEENPIKENRYAYFEECRDKSGQLFLKIIPCKLAKELKYTIPEQFVFNYYSKKYEEEEVIKGEGNVSFRDMLKNKELFEQLPEEQIKETLIPMKHKRFENCVVNDTGLQELIEEKLGILEDVEYITAPLHNAKYWKQYKPYRCRDGVEVDAKIATSKTLYNITEAIDSFNQIDSLDYGVGGLPK